MHNFMRNNRFQKVTHEEFDWNKLCDDTNVIILGYLFSSNCVKLDLELLQLRAVSKQFRHYAQHILHRSMIFRRASDLTSAKLEPCDFVRGIVAVLIDLAGVHGPKFPTTVYANLYYYIASEVQYNYGIQQTNQAIEYCPKKHELKQSLYQAAMGYNETTSIAAVLIHDANLCKDGERRVIETLGNLFRLLRTPFYCGACASIDTLLTRHLQALRAQQAH